MEVVVVLGDVCEDTEAVRDPEGQHVLRIQQSRDTKLLLSNTERLHRRRGGEEERMRRRRKEEERRRRRAGGGT